MADNATLEISTNTYARKSHKYLTLIVHDKMKLIPVNYVIVTENSVQN